MIWWQRDSDFFPGYDLHDYSIQSVDIDLILMMACDNPGSFCRTFLTWPCTSLSLPIVILCDLSAQYQQGWFCWNCIIRSRKGTSGNLIMFVQKHSDGSKFPRSPALSFRLAGKPFWKISFPPQSNPNLRFWRLCRGPQSCSRHPNNKFIFTTHNSRKDLASILLGWAPWISISIHTGCPCRWLHGVT